jgi:glycosyltransferase involved in cell wall biosynthesis
MIFVNRKISIIIPIYNEEENILPLTEKLLKSLKTLPLKKYEVIFVDDGSIDSTFEEILNVHKKYSFIKAIKLRRNFGKAAAYSVGFSQAKNDVIITMDGDLQDDPSEISLYLKKLDEGYDLVTGWKTTGKGTFEKTLLSRFFNTVVNMSFGIKLHDFNCPFKAYKKEVIKGIKLYSGLYRFIPIFASAYGFKIGEVKIKNHPRRHGKSKYGGKRVFGGLFDFLTVIFLTKFNQRPMYFFGTLAIFCILIGTTILSYLTFLSFKGIGVGSRPIFSLGVLLEILSLQFFSIGFIGEMFSRSIVDIKTEYLIEKIRE